MPLIEKDVPMLWDETARRKYDNATHCNICEKVLDRSSETPARDHCHFTGVFRGAVHKHCNLEYKVDKEKYKVPVIFHNLRGYDAHLIFQKIKQKHGKINVIPNTSEKYISFTVGCMKFLDSMQFLSASLEKLSAQLKENQFTHLNITYPELSKQTILRKKGVYPYDYMDDMARFEETSLPDIKNFYSRLSKKNISEKDYCHAKKVWDMFNCETMRDYHDLYLKGDVLLLADIFENFRKMVLETYGLDPVHYYSLPGLSWDAMLKYTGIYLFNILMIFSQTVCIDILAN